MACVTKGRFANLLSFGLGYSRFLSVAPSLAYEEFKSSIPESGSQDPKTVLILHGLLGQGRNWRTFAKTLVSRLSNQEGTSWRVMNLDLRCHGNSTALPGFNAPHTMHACAQDVCSFIQQRLQSHPDLVIGHSMGGKVAMEYVRVRADLEQAAQATPKPQNVWILDSQPGTVGPDLMPDVTRVLQAVQLMKVPVSDRAKVLDELRQQGFSEALVLWMASNLVPATRGTTAAARQPPQPGKNAAAQPLVWAFDVKGAADLYEDYKRLDRWDLLCAPPAHTTMNILRAERSDRWTEDMIRTLAECAAKADLKAQEDGVRGSTKIHLLPNAGHWVHMDNPKGLIDMIVESEQ